MAEAVQVVRKDQGLQSELQVVWQRPLPVGQSKSYI